MTTPIQAYPVAAAVAEALGDRPVKWLADETAIPRSTLIRRLKDGNFTVAELIAISAVLEIEPSSLVESA